jgi:hypothetical protein
MLGQRRLAGLGPSGRGGEKRAAHMGDRRGALSGCCWAGPNPRREMKIIFFFLFQYFKAFFQSVLNFSFVFSKSAHNTKYYAAA